MARVVFVVAASQFRDEELFDTRTELERAGHQVSIASTTAGVCSGMLGASVVATEAISAVDVQSCDAGVFIGGLGARGLFNDKAARKLARELYGAGRLTTAIGFGPVILANAGLLDGKRATVAESEVKAIEMKGALYQRIGVVTDGNVVTGSGTRDARTFGQEIVRQLAHRAAIARGRMTSGPPARH
jgi:protease I